MDYCTIDKYNIQNYMIANSCILVIDVNLYGNLLDPNLIKSKVE